ncbi:MAG TPA: 4Fe-4S binding protein [Armatimonadota bacterium]|jgi:Fe-S-cluster-containing hydrogenase component 2|nr:4Fe-4S binding protein [Armatimonadota bacterium]HOP79978.1 4Fe-4S binding protein [Armatimonadota bacterium]HPP74830.1 4Fe-4S binding protein [Armatimonadota bacterium]
MAINVDEAKCTGCGDCTEVCPTAAIAIENEKAKVSDECIDCGVCADSCPNGALELP